MSKKKKKESCFTCPDFEENENHGVCKRYKWTIMCLEDAERERLCE